MARKLPPRSQWQALPPRSLDRLLVHLARGGLALVPTMTRITLIEDKHIKAWAASGRPLLREEGDGYRMAQGKSSVYILPGQLVIA